MRWQQPTARSVGTNQLLSGPQRCCAAAQLLTWVMASWRWASCSMVSEQRSRSCWRSSTVRLSALRSLHTPAQLLSAEDGCRRGTLRLHCCSRHGQQTRLCCAHVMVCKLFRGSCIHATFSVGFLPVHEWTSGQLHRGCWCPHKQAHRWLQRSGWQHQRQQQQQQQQQQQKQHLWKRVSLLSRRSLSLL
jgi:hypothetical protein